MKKSMSRLRWLFRKGVSCPGDRPLSRTFLHSHQAIAIPTQLHHRGRPCDLRAGVLYQILLSGVLGKRVQFALPGITEDGTFKEGLAGTVGIGAIFEGDEEEDADKVASCQAPFCMTVKLSTCD